MMEHASESPSQPGMSRSRSILFLVAVLAAVAGSSTAFVSWRRASEVRFHPVDTGSPYENTRLGVKSIGDAACARCHAEIAATYRRHPMGQSLAPIASAPATGTGAAGGRVLFEAQGLEYSIEKREGHVIHQETRRDASGGIVARNEAADQLAGGYRPQAAAYLTEPDGAPFQCASTPYA